jgi:hypothetical protein
VNGDRIRAERHAREIVADMHWSGMVVPPLYARMAAEFQDLIHTGDYAAWVATGGSTMDGSVGVGEPVPLVSGDVPAVGSRRTLRSAAAASPRSWPR